MSHLPLEFTGKILALPLGIDQQNMLPPGISRQDTVHVEFNPKCLPILEFPGKIIPRCLLSWNLRAKYYFLCLEFNKKICFLLEFPVETLYTWNLIQKVACQGTSEVLDHTRNFHDFLNHPVPWISKVRTRGDINIKCNKHYQSNTCNKLPQSAQTLNFLLMVSLCLYSKCSKSLVYHGRPSPGSCEANSKKSLIWRDALLLVLDSSPPSVPILSIALFCTKRGVALLVVGSSVSILNLALFCTKRRVALLVVGSSVSILNLALFCTKRGVALLVVGSSVSILNLALFCSKRQVAVHVLELSLTIFFALFC